LEVGGGERREDALGQVIGREGEQRRTARIERAFGNETGVASLGG
jgi:hypothetical protein